MSDRNKIKDLLGRMVAMSPETPAYPDDVPTVQPVRPRRSGAWVFAAAGLTVAALALPFVFWQGGSAPIAGDTTTTMPPPTTASTDTPTTQPPK